MWVFDRRNCTVHSSTMTGWERAAIIVRTRGNNLKALHLESQRGCPFLLRFPSHPPAHDSKHSLLNPPNLSLCFQQLCSREHCVPSVRKRGGKKKKKKQKKHSKFWRSRSNGDVQNQFYGNGCVGTCASPRYSFFHQCWKQPCTSTCTFKRRFVPFSSFDSVIILMRKKVVLIWFGTRVFGKYCFYVRGGVCVYVYVDSGFAGVAIDQGIAYVLMLLALALTYIIHWQTAEAQKTDFSSLNFCVFSVFHFCFGFLAFVETGNLMVPYSLQYLEFFQFLALIVGTCHSCFFLPWNSA